MQHTLWLLSPCTCVYSKSLLCQRGYLEAGSVQAANQSKADIHILVEEELQHWHCTLHVHVFCPQSVRQPTCVVLVILIIIHFIFSLGCSCRSQYSLKYNKCCHRALISHQNWSSFICSPYEDVKLNVTSSFCQFQPRRKLSRGAYWSVN